MSMPKLFIHIGTHKTGTTAIQSALKESRARLESEGINYLQIPRAILADWTKKPLGEQEIYDGRNFLKKAVEKCRKDDFSRFIISSEAFSGTVYQGYKNSRLVSENLRAVTSGFDVNIIVYLRRQDDFIESMYTQMIHEGRSISFRDYVDQLDNLSFRWDLLLNDYARSFDKNNIIVRRYHKKYLPNKESILNEFGGLIGARSLSLESNSRPTNQGYSRDALEIARLINPHLTKDDRREFRQLLQRTQTKEPFDNYSFFSWEERESILSRYSDSNSIVAKGYFDEPNESLFPKPEPDFYYGEYQGLTFEQATKVLTKVILNVQGNSKQSSILGENEEFDVETAGVALTKAALFIRQNRGSIVSIALNRFELRIRAIISRYPFLENALKKFINWWRR